MTPIKMPGRFIKVYSGGQTSAKTCLTNRTEEEKRLFKLEVEKAGLQFDAFIVEQIRAASIIVRR